MLAIARQHHVRVCGGVQTWGITIEILLLGVLLHRFTLVLSPQAIPNFNYFPTFQNTLQYGFQQPSQLRQPSQG